MRTNLALAATTLALASAPVAAEALRIEHDAVGCVVAERYPRIDVRLEPADAVARARVYFRAVGTADWYFVEMRREAGLFQAALPKPQKATQAIDYYIQALDAAFAESQTPAYRPTVVNNAAGCSKDMRVAVFS